MAVTFENLARKLERRTRRLSKEPMPELYKLAIEVLIAERNLERRLEEAKTDEERKSIEERLKRVKQWRDEVIAAYIARCFGTSLPPIGEQPW